MIGLKDGDISESVKSFLTGVLDAPNIIITINKYLDDVKKYIIKDVYQFCPHSQDRWYRHLFYAVLLSLRSVMLRPVASAFLVEDDVYRDLTSYALTASINGRYYASLNMPRLSSSFLCLSFVHYGITMKYINLSLSLSLSLSLCVCARARVNYNLYFHAIFLKNI